MATIPQGWVPVRSLLESAGFNVGWDPKTGQISGSMAGQNPINIYQGGYQLGPDNRAYTDPLSLGSLLAANRMGNEAASGLTFSEASVAPYRNFMEQMYGPTYRASSKRLSRQLDAIGDMADAQLGIADSAYGQAYSNLDRRQSSDLLATTHQVAGKNLSGSPLAIYQKEKVKGNYAPEFQQLESNTAAAKDKIAAQASAQTAEIGGLSKDLEAAFLQNLMSGIFNMYTADTGRKDTSFNTLLNMLGKTSDAGLTMRGQDLNTSIGMLPYTTLTESQRQEMPLTYANLFGEMPTESQVTPGAGFGGQPLRGYADSIGMGGKIDFDPSTGNVKIDGKTYTPEALQRMGGQLLGGAWNLPSYVIDQLLGK